ncbi:MAG TPA: DNA/RNA non-specific endonuclease [Pyrinomonadaceae bacterium]|jgi:endonuclease G
MKRVVLFLTAICLCIFAASATQAQTNPAAQTLPFTLTSQTGSTLPAGVAVHRFGTTSGIPTTRTTAPGTGDLPYNSTSNAGGWRDEGANGISMLASGSQAAGALVVAINTTGQTNIQVTWTARTILQQASRDNSIALQYRVGTSGNFTDIDPTTYTSSGKSAGDAATFTNVALPAAAENQSVVQVRWIYWESTSTSGSRDRLAVDDISITANSGPATPNIVVSTTTLPDFGNVGVGGTSAPKSYTVSGSNLSSGITITAPADFQISTASNTGYTTTFTLAASGGSVPNTTVYVRFAPTGLGGRGGNITHESAGAETRNVAVSGTGVNGYTISGTVTSNTGTPLAGMTVNLMSGATTVATTTTDANGNYSFPGVAENGTYTVTPSGAGFTFTPPSQSFSNLNANQTANFSATPQVVISEFRFRGTDPDGAGALNGDTNEFIELYNQTDQSISLAGWSLVSSGGTIVRTLTNGQIPARAHYLIVGTSYGLGGVAAGDATLSGGTDIPDGTGVALFNNSSNFVTGARLDAVGFSGADSLYLEQGGLTPAGGITTDGEYSFVRKLGNGTPQDTDNNAADFDFVSTNGGTYNVRQSVLGAPGPENLGSPIQRNATINASGIDPNACLTCTPNRVRNTSDTGTNKTLGTLIIRRVWTNNTGLEVSRLRFRLVDLTTLNSPNVHGGLTQADLRALTSSNITVTRTDGSTINVQGTTLEEPPTQALGGGLNATLAVALAAPVANGATVNTQFVLGVEQSGKFRFFVNVEAATQAPPSSSVHLTMGNPSNATTDVNQPTNYLMLKQGFAEAYHRDRGTPVWTSWHLDSSWIGSTGRAGDFHADTSLPAGWYQVQPTDYQGSGYDRGHMTPSGDRTSTFDLNNETFLMTNMIPQLPANNQGPWADFESYCRTLVGQGNELYIISGGSGTQGTIANGHVTVPTQTWKVVIVLTSGTNDVSRVTTSTRTIAIVMPNSGTINTDWRTYRVSVDQVETLTSFNFFSNVDDGVENVIEATVDNQ